MIRFGERLERDKILEKIKANKTVQVFPFSKISCSEEYWLGLFTCFFLIPLIFGGYYTITDGLWRSFFIILIIFGLPSAFLLRAMIISDCHYEIHAKAKKIVKVTNVLFKSSTEFVCSTNDIISIAIDSEEQTDGNFNYYIILLRRNGERMRVTNKTLDSEFMVEEGALAAKYLSRPFVCPGQRHEKTRIYGM